MVAFKSTLTASPFPMPEFTFPEETESENHAVASQRVFSIMMREEADERP
jgi:hypothetical protein